MDYALVYQSEESNFRLCEGLHPDAVLVLTFSSQGALDDMRLCDTSITVDMLGALEVILESGMTRGGQPVTSNSPLGRIIVSLAQLCAAQHIPASFHPVAEKWSRVRGFTPSLPSGFDVIAVPNELQQHLENTNYIYRPQRNADRFGIPGIKVVPLEEDMWGDALYSGEYGWTIGFTHTNKTLGEATTVEELTELCARVEADNGELFQELMLLHTDALKVDEDKFMERQEREVWQNAEKMTNRDKQIIKQAFNTIGVEWVGGVYPERNNNPFWYDDNMSYHTRIPTNITNPNDIYRQLAAATPTDITVLKHTCCDDGWIVFTRCPDHMLTTRWGLSPDVSPHEHGDVTSFERVG